MQQVQRIDEYGFAQQVSAEGMDVLWSEGWRHQGTLFFRYSHCTMLGMEHDITPLRIDLSRFALSKSQRRICRKNDDLTWLVEPAVIDDCLRAMFHRHASRFVENVPNCLEDFLGAEPAVAPCECLAIRALLKGEVIAASFLDMGWQAVSSVYAIFEPEHFKRGLGTLTLLKEIEIARGLNKRYLYHGYGTRLPGPYDYKKRFDGVEEYDWRRRAWQLPSAGLYK